MQNIMHTTLHKTRDIFTIFLTHNADYNVHKTRDIFTIFLTHNAEGLVL